MSFYFIIFGEKKLLMSIYKIFQYGKIENLRLNCTESVKVISKIFYNNMISISQDEKCKKKVSTKGCLLYTYMFVW